MKRKGWSCTTNGRSTRYEHLASGVRVVPCKLCWVTPEGLIFHAERRWVVDADSLPPRLREVFQGRYGPWTFFQPSLAMQAVEAHLRLPAPGYLSG